MTSNSSVRQPVKLNKGTTVTLAIFIPVSILLGGIIYKFSSVENKTEINKTNIYHNCERLDKIDKHFYRMEDKLDDILKEVKN